MIFGSQPAPVVTRKRHVEPAPFMSPASVARPKQATINRFLLMQLVLVMLHFTQTICFFKH